MRLCYNTPMKKLAITAALLCSLLGLILVCIYTASVLNSSRLPLDKGVNPANVYAASALPAVQYMRITEAIPFYSAENGASLLFYLPATYYVALEEEGEEYDAVTYEDLHGYIRHASCDKVSYEPNVKYAESGAVALQKDVEAVRFYSDQACADKIAEYTVGDRLFLYGQAREGIYYCRLHKSYGVIYGYIGGTGVTVTLPRDNADQTAAPPADEPSDEQEEPKPNPDGGDDDVYETNLAVPVRIILIISLAVPAFLLVFLLTRKAKKK